MLGRHQVRGTEKNHGEPNQHRQPIFQENSNSSCRASVSQAKINGVSQKRPYKFTNLKSEIQNPKSKISGPLTFEPIFMERIWGGRKLADLFGKELPAGKRIGESWEIVDRTEAQSIVAHGPLKGKTLHELWTRDRLLIFGQLPDAPRFALLIKLLDAQHKLSLQVHPPERIARKLGGEPKTEFWYVSAADIDAELLLGFRDAITVDRFETGLRE